MADLEAYRIRRRRWLRRSLVTFGVISMAMVVYFARALLPPLAAAFLAAYLLKPLVYQLRRHGISTSWAVSIVTGGLLLLIVLTLSFALRVMPQHTDLLEIQIRAEYKMNQTFEKVLGLHSFGPGNTQPWYYQKFNKEVDFLISQLNSRIRVSEQDEKMLLAHYEANNLRTDNRYLKMLESIKTRPRWQPLTDYQYSHMNAQEFKTQLTHILGSVSLWIFFPILFIFFLMDDGSIFRFAMKSVPNHFFELTLTILERINTAIGHYIRGTAIECTMVGLVIGLGLWLFGINLQTSIVIGLVSGITNAVPFLGTFVGIAAGLTYALVADDITPLLPFLTADHIIIGVFASVGVAHVLDNAIFQPVFVGKAVHLHPIVVILSVAAGGVGFGFVGLLLAVPLVVTVKTCLTTMVAGLKDYRLI